MSSWRSLSTAPPSPLRLSLGMHHGVAAAGSNSESLCVRQCAEVAKRQFQDFEVQTKFAIDRQSLSSGGQTNFVRNFQQFSAIFSVDKLCLHFLSAFGGIFGGFLCRQSLPDHTACSGLSVRISWACGACVCRQSLSTDPRVKVRGASRAVLPNGRSKHATSADLLPPHHAYVPALRRATSGTRSSRSALELVA